MKNRVRLGIIGIGQIGRQSHLRAALGCEQVELTTLVDPNAARAERVAREFGIHPTVATDVSQVLDRIDAAIIATPNDTHCSIAIRCFDAGVSALIEKPLANSYADGLRIVEAAESSGVALAVGYCSRFRDNVRLLKELLEAGSFGRVRRFVHQVGTVGGWAPMSGYNLDRASSGGGVLVVTGSHFIDRMLYLWGYPDDVEFTDDSEGGPEANCHATFRFLRPGGEIEGYAIYSKSVFLPARLVIETDRGHVVAGDSDAADIVFRPNGETGIEEVVRRRGDASMQEDVFRLQIEDFVRAHRERCAPFVDGRQGLDSLRLIERLYACRQPMQTDWYTSAGALAGACP